MTNTLTPTPTTKPATVAPFAARLRDTLHRLNLTETQGADYLGVPVHTLRKWSAGTRTPSAVAVRLLDVLDLLETLAPALHAGLLPTPAVKRKRAVSPKLKNGPL